MAYTPAKTVIKMIWDSSDLNALGAVTNGLKLVGNLPQRARLLGSGIIITEGATGAGLSGMQIDIGFNAPNYNEYAAVSSAKGLVTNYTTHELDTSIDDAVRLMNDTTSTSVYAFFQTTGCNLDDLTAGAGIAYLEYEQLP